MGEWVVGLVVGEFMGWVVVGWLVGWRVHVVSAYTYPPIKSYSVKIFNFKYTHAPTHQTYPMCHSVTVHILWMVHGVGGWWWVVGGFMGWVERWWGGWLEGSWGGGGEVVGWLEGSWGGCVCGCVGGGGCVVGGFIGWVHILTHP